MLSYSVFVYVGTLTLYLQPNVQGHMDFQAELYGNSTCLCALEEVSPRVAYTVEGGVTGNLLVSDSVLWEFYGANSLV